MRGALAILLLLAAGQAQELKEKLGLPTAFVRQTGATPVTVAAGKPGRVTLSFRIAPGFHINSNKPGSELLIPTKLRLNPPTDLGFGSFVYPTGEKFTFAPAPDQPLEVYTGDFAISAKVSAARGASPGRYKVHGTLHYQACDDRACYPPKQLPVEFEVKVTKSSLPAPAQPSKPRRNPPQSPNIR